MWRDVQDRKRKRLTESVIDLRLTGDGCERRVGPNEPCPKFRAERTLFQVQSRTNPVSSSEPNEPCLKLRAERTLSQVQRRTSPAPSLELYEPYSFIRNPLIWRHFVSHWMRSAKAFFKTPTLILNSWGNCVPKHLVLYHKRTYSVPSVKPPNQSRLRFRIVCIDQAGHSLIAIQRLRRRSDTLRALR
jgi:hypothetical protein